MADTMPATRLFEAVTSLQVTAALFAQFSSFVYLFIVATTPAAASAGTTIFRFLTAWLCPSKVP